MDENFQQPHVGTVNANNSQIDGAVIGVNNGNVNHSYYYHHSSASFSFNHPISTAVESSALSTRFILDKKTLSDQPILRTALLTEIYVRMITDRIIIIQVGKNLLSRLVIEEVARFLHNRIASHPPIRILDNIVQYDPDKSLASYEFELCAELQSINDASVLLIPNASRQHLGWSFEDVRVTAEAKDHYILVTTELDKNTWRLEPSDMKYWKDIRTVSIFEPGYLDRYLLHALHEKQPNLPQELHHKTDPGDNLTNALTVSGVAQQLQNPVNIDAWLLAVIQGHRSEKSLDYEMLIKEFSSQDIRHLFKRWFYSALSDSDRLLLLAVYVLEGSTERQILAALQELMYNEWSVAGSMSNFVDRIHLQKFHVFYTFEADHFADLPINGLATIQRDELQALLLQNYRKHLENTVLWLPKVIKDSFERDTVETALFGFPEQRDALRSAISVTLSDLGVTTRDVVTPAYLELVADEEQAVHFFLGRTLARWYTLGYMAELTSLLKYWQSDKRVSSKIDNLLAVDGRIRKYSSKTLLNSVILISIAYAWRDEKVDNFPKELQDLMVLVVQDTSKRIKDLLLYNVIPMLWSRHLIQFSAVLQTLVLEGDFRDYISTQIAKLYRSNKLLARDLIHEWTVTGLLKVFENQGSHSANYGENMLLTISVALSKVPQYTSDEVYIEILCEDQCNILSVIRHPELRALIWDSCFVLASTDHGTLYALLLQTEPSEATTIIGHLTRHFARQRVSMSGIGDPWLPQRQPRFPGTQSGETTVEKALLSLIHNSTRPHLQQFAFQALFDCGGYVSKRLPREFPIPSVQPCSDLYVGSKESLYHTLVVLPLATQGQPEVIQETARSLLDLARQYYADNMVAFELTMNRMNQYQSPRTQGVAACLRQVMLLDADQWWGLRTVSPQRVLSVMVALWQSNKLPQELLLRILACTVVIALIAISVVYFLFWAGWIFLGMVTLIVIVGIGFWLYKQIATPVTPPLVVEK